MVLRILRLFIAAAFSLPMMALGSAPAAVFSTPFSFGETEADCGGRDLRSPLGPIRDQGNIGWCFANAAADLLTFKYHSALHGDQVSADALAIAYNYSWAWRQPNESAGYEAVAVAGAKRFGMCLRSVETELLKGGVKRTLAEKLDYLLNLKKSYDAFGFDRAYASLQKDAKGSAKGARRGPETSPLLKMPKADLQALLAESNEKTFLQNLANYFCQGRTVAVPGFPIVRNADFGSVHVPQFVTSTVQNLALFLIHHQLDQNNIVAVSYSTQFFHQPIETPIVEMTGMHESVIVGRRWAHHRCELLLRNSWGPGCGGYSNPELRSPGVCDKGNLWIAEKEFGRYLAGLTYIKP